MEQLSGLFFFGNNFCQHGHSWEGSDLASALYMILVATTVGWRPTRWWCNKGVTQVLSILSGAVNKCTMHTAHCTALTDWWPLGWQVQERLDVCSSRTSLLRWTLLIVRGHLHSICGFAFALSCIFSTQVQPRCALLTTKRKHKWQFQIQSNNQ